jgi:CRISPR-associated endoribonuclease Cas6
LRALLLRWLASVDAGLAEALHAADRPKPYTIGPLLPCGSGAEASEFRVTVLDDSLLPLLGAALLKAERTVRLGPALYRLGQSEVTHSSSWEELLEPASALRELTFRLLTPTAHHGSGAFRKSLVLPQPELYFASWLMRWNLYAPSPLDAGVLRVVENFVAISHCAGETQHVLLDTGRPFIGFTGTVTFAVLQPSILTPEDRRSLLALARFAEFSGTGVETMRGMGQTRFLDSP